MAVRTCGSLCPPLRLLCESPSLFSLSRPRPPLALLLRGLRTRARANTVSRVHKFTASEHRSWMLRLAHENSYLSWSRNAAICAGVGATLMIVEMQCSVPMADYYAIGFIDLGLAFIVFGSFQHLYSAYRLRKLLQLSLPGYLWILGYTSAFGLIYYALAIVQRKFKILPSTTDLEEET